MHWKTKALAFRTLEVVPWGDRAHFLLQRYVTKSWPRKPATLDALLARAELFVSEFRRHSSTPLSDATFLEIGSGRDLCVPLALRALGVGRVVTVDIARLAQLDLVAHAARHVAMRLAPGEIITDWRELADYGVDYRAPIDMTGDVDLPAIDAFVSNEVLEHIPPAPLGDVLRRAARAMNPGGVAVHTIDYSDHYARGTGVSRFNFLRYSDAEWSRFNSGFQYVNRLRHGDYLDAFRDAGFEILAEEPRYGDLPADLPITARFRGRDDLDVMGSRIVARRGSP